MWGILNMDVHLFGLQDDQVFWHILGTDKLGRDVFSRLLYGGRVSLGIGLIGIAISLAVGRWLDSRAGYYSWVFGIPYLIVSEIWLSPMGMGLRPPVISWGTLIGLEIRAFPNLVVDVQGLAGPALAGAWTVLLFISIGRGLRRLATAPASNRASGARKSGRER